MTSRFVQVQFPSSCILFTFNVSLLIAMQLISPDDISPDYFEMNKESICKYRSRNREVCEREEECIWSKTDNVCVEYKTASEKVRYVEMHKICSISFLIAFLSYVCSHGHGIISSQPLST